MEDDENCVVTSRELRADQMILHIRKGDVTATRVLDRARAPVQPPPPPADHPIASSPSPLPPVSDSV